MNEKELREEWEKAYIKTETFGSFVDQDKVADYWLARIKERDERLKEKIREMKYQQTLLGAPFYTEVHMEAVNKTADDIINLIDNHA